ncbi:MAG: aminotransferase class V-fold PLP-dependent enzyme [Clostridiales bacterium]|nr:aminotransferase class V-fold PLP-dependent enzyme [Clostridiales bacterium]
MSNNDRFSKFEQQRQYYPVLGYKTFLNTAQNGLIPTYASQSMQEYIERRHLNALDVITMSAQWDDLDIVRAKIGRMINAKSTEILFGSSMSELMNIFSNGIGLKKGDNVIIYDSTYFSTSYIWFNKREQLGIEVRIAESDEGRTPCEKLFELADENTKAILVCHVDFGSGFRHDLAQIGAFCKERGIAFAVDGTQACGAMKVDVKEMNIDFYATSTYKWLQCLLGLGFAYIDEKFLPKLSQSVIGWVGTVDKLHNDAMVLELCDEARKFECGGISFIAIEGLTRVVDNYLRLGADDIEEYILSLADHCYERAEGLKKCRVYGPVGRENRSGIVTVTFPESFGISREMLDAHQINAMMQGSSRVRLAMHYYNNTGDIDRFFDLLEELEAEGK